MRVLLLVTASLLLWGQDERFYRSEKERALGSRLAEEARQRNTAFENLEFQRYVEGLARVLAASLPEPRPEFRFSAVVEDAGGPSLEPFSFPGGFIVIPARLILETRNEPEFAGMVAHVMAHCAERHGMRSEANSPLVYVGGWNGLDGRAAVPTAMRPAVRRFERDADAAAIKMMTEAGFDAGPFGRYLKRTIGDDERVAAVEQALLDSEKRPAARPAQPEFGEVRERIRRLLK